MNTLQTFTWDKKPPLGTPIDWTHPLAQGLTNCWLFNDLIFGRSIQPYVSNAVTGVRGSANNTPTISNSPYGAVLTVPTTNRYGIKTNIDYHYLGGTGPYTMACLATFETLEAAPHEMMTHGSNSHLYAHSATEIGHGVIGTGGGVVALKSGVTVGPWYHCCAVFDGTTVQVYLDGVAGTPQTSDRIAADKDFGLCCNFHTFDPDSLDGSMAWAFLWDRALTPDLIEWHMAAPFAMFATEPWMITSVPATILIEDDGLLYVPIIGTW